MTFGDRIQNGAGLPPGLRPRELAPARAALSIAALLAAIAGFIVGVPSLRLRGDYLAIVTLGFGEIIRVFILNIDAVGGARGFSGIPKLSNFFWIYLFAAATILVVYRIVHSSFGRTLVAIREDEIAAEAMGVHTTRAKVISFVVSSAMAGVAGGLFAHYLMYIHTNSFTFLKSFEIIIMIVIGGLGSISGSVLGAVLFIGLTEGLRRVRPVPDDPVLAAADRDHDRAAAGNPGPQGVRDLPDAAPTLDRGGPRHDRGELRSRVVPMSILRLSRVTMRFGGLVAVNELDMEIAPKQLYGLIGPNGAGKTTVFNVITGVYTPTEGDITFEGKSIGGQRCGRITRRGIARTFQNIRLFSEMSVLDNVKVAFDCRQATTLTTAVLRTRSHKAEEDRVDSESRELLKIFKLDHLADEKAKNLPVRQPAAPRDRTGHGDGPASASAR